MEEIVGLTRTIVDKAKNFDESGFKPKPLGFNGPNGKPMVETLRNYETEDGSFQLRKVLGGRLLEPLEAKALIEKRLIGPLEGFRSKAGWPFAAALKLNDAGETEFVFDNTPTNVDGTPLDVEKQEPIGKCPICGGRVFETLMAYACEHTFGDAPTCKMKIQKKILMQEIDRTQAIKLLTEKKTDLLRGFVSIRKFGRKFSAFLVMGAEGKASFEFEPRPEGAKGKKPFVKKESAPESNGHAGGRSVVPKNVVKARRGSKKK
jgi:DNA topoisomerase-3